MLREREDAYGRAMLDHLEGRRADEIVERDDGYIYVGAGPPLYFAPYAKWRSHERRSMRYVRGPVLDVGCGAGRALVHLRERGVRGVGIDNSPLAVEVCRRRGLTDVQVRSVTELEGLGPFDTVLLLGGGFGLFGNRPVLGDCSARCIPLRPIAAASSLPRGLLTRTPTIGGTPSGTCHEDAWAGSSESVFGIDRSARLGGITSRSRRTSSEVLSKAPAGN